MYDIIIAGGGPAGMTAAIYARRSGKSVLLLEREGYGGQIAYAPRVENYPGVASVGGAELAERMLEQMLALDAETDVGEVLSVERAGENFTVRTEDGVYESRAVILATAQSTAISVCRTRRSFSAAAFPTARCATADFIKTASPPLSAAVTARCRRHCFFPIYAGPCISSTGAMPSAATPRSRRASSRGKTLKSSRLWRSPDFSRRAALSARCG